jgi:hypothetical protein
VSAEAPVPGDPPDLAEAVDYILGERPRLDEDDVWAVLIELGSPPAPRSDDLALALIARTRPRLRRRDAKRILREWRAYVALAGERDWEEGELPEE